MLRIILFFLILFVSSPLITKGQEEENLNDSINRIYTFIKTSKNHLGGDSTSLYPFFARLAEIENGSRKTAEIVHIGDSHIQAGYIPGVLRGRLQNRFGNAGLGLMVPYKVAKTNEPPLYRSFSTGKWRGRRIVIEKDSLNIGLGGVTVRTEENNSMLGIKVPASSTMADYSFNEVQIFHDKNPSVFQLVPCDSSNCVITGIEENQSDSFSSSYKLPGRFTELHIFNAAADTLRHYSEIYGLVLKNSEAGIRYHAIAVNGAEYRHYNKHPLVSQQLSRLHPSLIIVSLGTNEAYAPRFNTEEFYHQIDSLVNRLKSQNPDCSFILCTPGDANKRRKYKNPNNNKARQTVLRYAKENNLASWDLFTVMGGYGSIQKWFNKGLTSKDKLHLNKRGYEIQGLLLYSAIIESYEKYLNNVNPKP